MTEAGHRARRGLPRQGIGASVGCGCEGRGRYRLHDLIDSAGPRRPDGRRRVAEHEGEVEPRTLADKLNHLARTVHPEGRGPYTLDETVAGIRELGGSVSRANLNALRLGRGDNPSKATIEAIARFYRVSPGYLLDDSPYDEITAEEHELLLIVRSGQLHELIRSIGRLQPQTRQALERVVADLHAMHSTEQPDHPA